MYAVLCACMPWCMYVCEVSIHEVLCMQVKCVYMKCCIYHEMLYIHSVYGIHSVVYMHVKCCVYASDVRCACFSALCMFFIHTFLVTLLCHVCHIVSPC